jgi:hypothetical protein
VLQNEKESERRNRAMKLVQSLGCSDVLRILVILVGALSIGPVLLWSQLSPQPGDPIVYNNSTQMNSHAYIDATAFVGTHTDFCTILNQALQALNGRSTGTTGVIDARGVNPATLTCNSNPWGSFGPVAPTAVVLLPAGTIKTNATWVLPSGTRLIGEGGEDPGSNPNATARTTLQAQSLFTPMIQMGNSSPCKGVVVEDLVLDGNKQAVDGIDNQYCQELSYINHVSIYQATAKGLNIFNSAQNSGPYTNITFDLGNAIPTSSTVCAYVAVSTRGIRGMTCTAGITATSTDAIQVVSTGSGNSIEDVRIEGFQNGVYVNASDVVLMNILGDSTTKNTSQIVSVVNIASATVANVVLIGISNNCSTSSNCGTSSNNDSVTDNTANPVLHLPVTSDPFVAMYSVGNKIAVGTGNAVSRYTTSSSVPSWLVGAGPIAPGTVCNAPPMSPVAGSLYSNASSGDGLYVCSISASQWSLVK